MGSGRRQEEAERAGADCGFGLFRLRATAGVESGLIVQDAETLGDQMIELGEVISELRRELQQAMDAVRVSRCGLSWGQ